MRMTGTVGTGPEGRPKPRRASV